MKIKTNVIIVILALILFMNVMSATLNVQLSDRGSNVKYKNNNSLINGTSLTVTIYDAASGGNMIYNESFSSIITNGSWRVMLGWNSSNPLPLKFNKAYYKDYKINGEDINFTNSTGGTTDRQLFYSPLGDIDYGDINHSSNITAAAFNSTGSIFSQNNNLSLGYFYATNGSAWSNTGNYSNFSTIVYGYAINGSTWSSNYSNFSVGWNYATNSTGDLAWSTAYNGTLAKTDAANTFGNFNQTMNGTTFFLWSLLNRIGIGTTTPQNVLNVVGDINATTSIFSQGNNLSLAYFYAINNTWDANYSNFSRIYGNVTDYNASWTSTTNTTYHTGYLYATNGTYLLKTGDNGTGEYNFNDGWQSGGLTIKNGDLYAQAVYVYNITSLAVNNLAVNGSLLPQQGWNNTFDVGNGTYAWKNLHLGGDANIVGNILSAGRNLTIGYDYALNDSLWTLNYSDFLTTRNYALNDSLWTLNYSNFSRIYGNVTDYNASWTSTTNTTYHTGYLYATNGTYLITETNWNANYSNFSTLYANQLGNASASGISWATANNGTLLNYSNALNGTLLQGSNVTYAYSLNASLWSLNYSNFSTLYANQLGNTSSGISWDTAYNGTLAKTDAANTFGNFNQTMNGSLLTINSTYSRVGINSSTPQNILNVVGDINGTTGIFSQDKNLSVGYDYATNNTWNANYSNFSNIYAYTQNGTLISWSNAINGTLASWANVINGTVIQGNNATYAYSLNDSLWSASANYSNFSTIVYGYAINSTGGGVNYSNILSNQTFNSTFGYFNVTNQTSSVFIVNDTGAFVNGSIINFNISNIIYPYAVNGSTFALNYSNFSNNYAMLYNGSLITPAQLSNGTTILGTNTTYAYSLNDSLWSATANYSNFSTIVYGYAVNSTGSSVNYSNILSNQTYNFTNGYFNLTNQTGTVVLGNNTGLFINGSVINFNISNIIYPYAINGSTWALNYSNFSNVYAYTQNGSLIGWGNAVNGTLATWANVINGTVIQGNNATYSYSLNNSLWSLNYSNFSTLYANSFSYYNSTNLPVNYTNVLANQSFNATNGYFNVTNQTSNVFLANNSGIFVNGSIINFNLSNIIYGYAVNDTGGGVSWSEVINGTMASWANAVNGTLTTWAQAVNTSLRAGTNNSFFGVFNLSNASLYQVISTSADGNITFDRGGFFYDNVLNKTGINTTAPQDTLNIIGTLNVTNGTNGIGSLYVGANGKVGIGNSTPANTLIVAGDTNTTGGVYLTNTKCSAGQVLKSDATTGLVSCVTDATSGGGRTLNSTSADITTFSTTFNTSILALDVSANTNYTWGCDLIANSSVATTGVQFNVSVPASPNKFTMIYTHYTTAIASYTGGCIGNATSVWTNCTNLSAGNPVTFYPIEIKGRLSNGANAGIINISVKSEVGTTPVTIKGGSYCHAAAEV
ncbi:hypothetical protein HYT24_02575 [Candidatus Pacearchaeota archaeon]|nr:hypothetical protein [Candidatus Pacearchaeota archaeon]